MGWHGSCIINRKRLKGPSVLIPILGSSSELRGGADAPKSGAQGAETGAVGGVFGEILNAATASGGAQTAHSDAQGSGGKFLPTGGNLLPSAVQGDADAISVEALLAGANSPLQSELEPDLTSVSALPAPLDGVDVPHDPHLLVGAIPPLDEALIGISDLVPADAIADDAITSLTADAVIDPEVLNLETQLGPLQQPSPTQPIDSDVLPAADAQTTIPPATPIVPVTSVTPPATGVSGATEALALTGVRPVGAGANGVVGAKGIRSEGSLGAGQSFRDAPAIGLGAQGNATDLGRTQPFTAVMADKVLLEGADFAALADAGAQKPLSTAPAQAAPGAIVSSAFNLESVTATSKPSVLPPLTVPLGEPEWGPELAGRVSLMLKNGTQEASLQLNPPELGRLDIRIVTEGDQARVQFSVQNPEARDVIEQSMPRLREMLEQSGLQLAGSDVADQSESRQSPDSSAASGTDGTAENELHADITTQQLQLGDSRSQVDYYV